MKSTSKKLAAKHEPLTWPAHLLLSNGSVYSGLGFGAKTGTDGEVVFTTGMVGYPESLSDPSFRGQILTFTFPLLGSYGVPDENVGVGFESDRIQARAVITQQYQHQYSHWTATQSLHEWMERYGVPGISGIDTRALTKELRTHGVLLGTIVAGKAPATAAQVKSLVKKIVDPNLSHLVSEVSVSEPVTYLPKDTPSRKAKKRIILVDCGVKQSIIDNFVNRGLEVRRVPWDYNYTKELKDYDGLFISNGPGDPKQCKATIKYAREALQIGKPFFGICLGSQIQGLAAGAQTYKLPFGHRGQNQPCVIADAKGDTHRAILTSQNHGFAVKESTIPKDWRVLFRNANDNSVEGLRHKTKPFFSAQFHPEATPGPEDANYLFDEFIDSL